MKPSNNPPVTPGKKRGLRIVAPPSPYEKNMPPLNSPIDAVQVQTPITKASICQTLIHEAVLSENVKAVESLLMSSLSLIDRQDEHGFTPLMNAAASKNDRVAADMARLLLKHNADTSLRDIDGFSCLHWAAACGNSDTIKLLISSMKSRYDTKTQTGKFGETPLHRASRFGHENCVSVLLDAGAEKDFRNDNFESAYDVAGLYEKRINKSSRCRVRRTFNIRYPSTRTLLVSHDDCLNHLSHKLNHQESPRRISSILKLIKSITYSNAKGLSNGISKGLILNQCMKPSLATFEHVQRAHTEAYVSLVKRLAKQVENSLPIPFTPHVQRTLKGLPLTHLKEASMCDTSFSNGSLNAALGGVGSVIHAYFTKYYKYKYNKESLDRITIIHLF